MVDGADGAEQLQPPPPRHLLVEQDHSIRLPLQQHQRVVAVGRRLHGETLLFQKQDMEVLEELDDVSKVSSNFDIDAAQLAEAEA